MTTTTTSTTPAASTTVEATPVPKTQVDGQTDLADLTVQWLNALLASARIDRIGRAHWWPRATSALETAAATAETYGHAVSEAARKLEIDVISAPSAQALADLEPHLAPRMSEWATCIAQEAPYLIARTRLHRSRAIT